MSETLRVDLVILYFSCLLLLLFQFLFYFIAYFSNIEMVIDVPEAKEVTFTLISNKKCKRKSKVSSFLSISFFDSKSKTLLIS